MVSRKLFIHAVNVHQGGGRSLLHAILNNLPNDIDLKLSLDSRMSLPDNMLAECQIRRVTPSILNRFAAERWLAESVASGDLVLCFGNLPPLFKLRGKVTVFVQNRYLIDEVKLSSFPFKTRLRIEIERLWLSNRVSNVDEFIVQTPSMKHLLEARTKGRTPVSELPFIDAKEGHARQVRVSRWQENEQCEFLYVASGEPHKNHRILIDAWCLLANKGLFPILKLTVDRKVFEDLCIWMEQKIELHQLKVHNLGNLASEETKELYSSADALIYPSTFESFGLPLIEARQAGLPVLAAELDFVRDVLDPEQTFDPASAISIVRAVKRFLGISEQVLQLQDDSGFMEYILAQSD